MKWQSRNYVYYQGSMFEVKLKDVGKPRPGDLLAGPNNISCPDVTETVEYRIYNSKRIWEDNLKAK